MTVFWKTDCLDTNTEIHFLPVDESHTHACSIQRHQALETRWLGLLLQGAFSDTVKPQGCLSWPFWPLRAINKTAWGAKLILMADLAYTVSYASLGHLPMTKHCSLSLNVCFNLPTVPIHPHYPPHPLKTKSMLLQPLKKTTSITRGI